MALFYMKKRKKMYFIKSPQSPLLQKLEREKREKEKNLNLGLKLGLCFLGFAVLLGGGAYLRNRAEKKELLEMKKAPTIEYIVQKTDQYGGIDGISQRFYPTNIIDRREVRGYICDINNLTSVNINVGQMLKVPIAHCKVEKENYK